MRSLCDRRQARRGLSRSPDSSAVSLPQDRRDRAIPLDTSNSVEGHIPLDRVRADIGTPVPNESDGPQRFECPKDLPSPYLWMDRRLWHVRSVRSGGEHRLVWARPGLLEPSCARRARDRGCSQPYAAQGQTSSTRRAAGRCELDCQVGHARHNPACPMAARSAPAQSRRLRCAASQRERRGHRCERWTPFRATFATSAARISPSAGLPFI